MLPEAGQNRSGMRFVRTAKAGLVDKCVVTICCYTMDRRPGARTIQSVTVRECLPMMEKKTEGEGALELPHPSQPASELSLDSIKKTCLLAWDNVGSGKASSPMVESCDVEVMGEAVGFA